MEMSTHLVLPEGMGVFVQAVDLEAGSYYRLHYTYRHIQGCGNLVHCLCSRSLL